MDITKSNFKEFLPQVKEAIEECDFLAIDTELTGLCSSNPEHAFDTVEERYQKLRRVINQFIIIQFGISTFRYSPTEKRYIHRDFNFYVVPRHYSRNASDVRFLCQASSMEYLANQKFDFNKLFYEGISFLSSIEEYKVKEQLTERHESQIKALDAEEQNSKKRGEVQNVTIPVENREFIDNIRLQIDALLSSDSETSIKLPQCNSFLRRLIYQRFKYEHSEDLDLSSDSSGIITVTKVTETGKRGVMKDKQDADMRELDDAVGFRKVIDMLRESRKLIVGHHMLLDLMHTINQFYHPLPETFGDFQEILKCNFPFIADTKMIASSKTFKDCFQSTVLCQLLSHLQSDKLNFPQIDAFDGYKGYELSELKLHEAGFDAFITGVCFSALMKKLTLRLKNKSEFVSLESNLLKPFLNRLYMLKSYDISDINLSGYNPEPSRDNVFYVTFPREWKTVDLYELFSPFGNIYIHWLNDTSALVALKMAQNKGRVIKALVHNGRKNVYKVITYSDYIKMQAVDQNENSSVNNNTVATSCTVAVPSKRKRSSNDEEMEKCSPGPISSKEEIQNPEISDSADGGEKGKGILKGRC